MEDATSGIRKFPAYSIDICRGGRMRHGEPRLFMGSDYVYLASPEGNFALSHGEAIEMDGEMYIFHQKSTEV